jgi:5-methylcytosine-specific restriction protein A
MMMILFFKVEMPIKPKVKRKPWHEPRKQHQRVKDMRWFYNSRKWRNFSKAYKQRNPICVECEQEGIVTPSKVTDHIDTFEVCPEGFDLDNLKDEYFQPLCSSCHNKKSGREAHSNKNQGDMG